jgi:hypothetical protein
VRSCGVVASMDAWVADYDNALLLWNGSDGGLFEGGSRRAGVLRQALVVEVTDRRTEISASSIFLIHPIAFPPIFSDILQSVTDR